MHKISDHLSLVLYCGLIFWLSSQETLPTPLLFTNQDKLHHFAAYFVLGLFSWRSFRHTRQRPIILAIASITFGSLYGLSDEWHQSFVPGRNSSAADWLADTTGVLTAQLLLLKYAQQCKLFQSYQS